MRIAYEGEGYLCSGHVGELLTSEENSFGKAIIGLVDTIWIA